MLRMPAALVALAVLLPASLLAAAQARPNIVLILADDMGSGDLGCYNPKSKISTPHMDRLAQAGMRFHDAHTPSAVCTPTRYGLLTGRYAWRSRLKSGVLWGFSTSLIEPGRMTLASLMKKHGYATGGVGKWHLGFQEYDPSKGERQQRVDYSQPLRPGPLTVGFDSYFGIPASLDMEPYVYVRDDGVVQQPTEKVAASKHRRQNGGGFWRGGPIAPDFKHLDVLPKIGAEAVAFIDRHGKAASEKPFFLYVPLSAPHTPWLPTEAWRGKCKAGYYGDFVAQVDATVGQILAALDRHQLADNTLVVLTSDNGSHWPVSDIEKWDHAANLHYRGQKADIHEGGHRVPFIVRWPGKVQPNSECSQTICLTDMMATLAAVLGDKLPQDAGEDSYNILPALVGKDGGKPIREATVHHSARGMFAIRQGNWKLIEGLGSGGFTNPRTVKPKPDGPQGQLYNLADDPSEQNNLWLEKPEVVERLHNLLEQYKKSGRSAPSSS